MKRSCISEIGTSAQEENEARVRKGIEAIPEVDCKGSHSVPDDFMCPGKKCMGW